MEQYLRALKQLGGHKENVGETTDNNNREAVGPSVDCYMRGRCVGL